MKNHAVFRIASRLVVTFSVLTLLLVLTAGEIPAAPVAEQDPQAKAILLKMADFLSGAPAFSVTMRSGYDAIQADGQVIEFGERRRILLQRPDRVRIEVDRSDGDQDLILFDGKALTAFKANDKVYARAEHPGTLDDAIVYLVRDMQMTLPLARMFRTELASDLEKQLTAVSYVEENTLFEVPTDHLVARSDQIDLQIWIAQGEQPLPRRVILTYKNAPGQPQFRADFLDWRLSPALSAESFMFTPPADAEQIPFIAHVRQQGSLPAQKGGPQ